MANISIKDVPEAWAEALRQRAARNHRSLQGELMALLEQEDGGTKSLLQRAGVNTAKLERDLKAAIERLPRQQGGDGNISIGRDLNGLLNLTDKEATKRGDQFIASELFLLALTDDKAETGRLFKDAGASRKTLEAAITAVRGVTPRAMQALSRASLASYRICRRP